MAGEIPSPEIDEAVGELDKVREEWLKRPGVTGVDVGLRRGSEGKELAIRVYVERKLAPDALPQHDIFPDRLGRFPVEVIEARFGPEQA
jgi:hypothetical protein